MKLAYQVYEMLDATAEPIEFPDNQRVALTQCFLGFGQAGPLGPAAADLVLEDLFAARFGQGLGLQFV